MNRYPKKRGIAIVALVAATAIVTDLRAGPAPSNPTNASFLLVGATNVASGRVATFVLSNGTPAHIACIPEAIEQQTNGSWTKTSLFGKAQRLVRAWSGVPEELQPKQTASFKVPAPITNGSWRLIFHCQEQKPIADRAADIYHHLTSTNDAQTQLRQFSGRSYSVVSPEVRP